MAEGLRVTLTQPLSKISMRNCPDDQVIPVGFEALFFLRRLLPLEEAHKF